LPIFQASSELIIPKKGITLQVLCQYDPDSERSSLEITPIASQMKPPNGRFSVTMGWLILSDYPIWAKTKPPNGRFFGDHRGRFLVIFPTKSGFIELKEQKDINPGIILECSGVINRCR
jgi:hypothetical protein